MIPLEFVIPTRPVSQQARRQDRLRDWKDYVRELARGSWESDQPCETPVAITVIYLYDEAALDADNIVKPIQDALVGLVFEDDAQVTDIVVRKRVRRGTFRLDNATPTLAAGFDLDSEFVYVSVTDAPPQDELL